MWISWTIPRIGTFLVAGYSTHWKALHSAGTKQGGAKLVDAHPSRPWNIQFIRGNCNDKHHNEYAMIQNVLNRSKNKDAKQFHYQEFP